MNILIVGSGRVGAALAGLLDEAKHQVTIVDRDRGSFAHLPAGSGVTTFLGNGIDLDVLRQVGIEKVDAFLALTDGDNRNLMAAQIAKQIFGVKRVFAKCNDPIRAEIYRTKGLTTFSRTSIIAVLLKAMLEQDPEVGQVLLQRTLAFERKLAGEEVRETTSPVAER